MIKITNKYIKLKESITVRIVLFVIDILVLLLGAGRLKKGKSSFHEIEAFTIFLITVVLLSGIIIIESINSFTKAIHPNSK